MASKDFQSLAQSGLTKLNYSEVLPGYTQLIKLSSGREVHFQEFDRLDVDRLGLIIDFFRSTYGTRFNDLGLYHFANEIFVEPLSLEETQALKDELYRIVEFFVNTIDDSRYSDLPLIRPAGVLEHENSVFAEFWRAWRMAVMDAIAFKMIEQSVLLDKMSDLLLEYTDCPTVEYKRPNNKGRCISQRCAFPIWVRNWFHHAENECEPNPPSRREIALASDYLLKFSALLHMSDEEKRTIKNIVDANENERMVAYPWLNAFVWASRSRDEFSVSQNNTWEPTGWKCKTSYREYEESGMNFDEYVEELRRRAKGDMNA